MAHREAIPPAAEPRHELGKHVVSSRPRAALDALLRNHPARSAKSTPQLTFRYLYPCAYLQPPAAVVYCWLRYAKEEVQPLGRRHQCDAHGASFLQGYRGSGLR